MSAHWPWVFARWRHNCGGSVDVGGALVDYNQEAICTRCKARWRIRVLERMSGTDEWNLRFVRVPEPVDTAPVKLVSRTDGKHRFLTLVPVQDIGGPHGLPT